MEWLNCAQNKLILLRVLNLLVNSKDIIGPMESAMLVTSLAEIVLRVLQLAQLAILVMNCQELFVTLLKLQEHLLALQVTGYGGLLE